MRIFDGKKGISIPKRESEKIYGLKIAFNGIDFNSINSFDDLINKANNLPGDLQRTLRTFHELYNRYGLKKEKEQS